MSDADKKPWEGETPPDEALTPAQKGAATKAANAAAALEDAALNAPSDDDTPVDTKQLSLDVQIVMGKLAEQGIGSDVLMQRATELEVDDGDQAAVLTFLEAQLELTKPVAAVVPEQASLALANLVSQGVSMKKAKKQLGIK